MTGTTLSQYRILEELGRGGMGIVYKAEDTKLERQVALKILPAAALASEDDRARFYREAKAAAALNHPNIAQIYQIDEAVPEGSPTDDVRPFIAMEFIEGGTIEDRIKQGPLKLDEAVRIATQVADALKAAHAKDIVHRDIKSANIMLTNEGQAKVLDFGLAQTAHSTKLTRMGSTLGTVAYMSPEQARGEEVDGRTDIWALGVVLYEMCSGQHPFPGDYEQAVVYSILNEDPQPLTALRTGFPMGLEWIIGKCVAKTANDRYQRAEELIVDLRTVDLQTVAGISRVAPSAIVPEAPRNTSVTIYRLGWFVAVFGWILAGALWKISSPNSEPLPLKKFVAEIPGIEHASWPVFSADGTKLYMNGNINGAQMLVQHDLKTGETSQLNDRTSWFSVLSPDEEEIVFIDSNRLYRMTFDQGIVTPLASVPASFEYLFFMDEEHVLFRNPEAYEYMLVDINSGEVGSYWSSDFMGPIPDLPEETWISSLFPFQDSRSAIVTLQSQIDPLTPSFELAFVKDGQIKSLVTGGAYAQFSEDGFIVFLEDITENYYGGRLMSQLFDPETGQLHGPKIPVLPDDNLAVFRKTVSRDGDILVTFMTTDWDDLDDELIRIDPSAGEYEVIAQEGLVNHPKESRDGARTLLASWSTQESRFDAVIVDNATGARQVVMEYVDKPIWSPDEQGIYFLRGNDLMYYGLDGSNEEVLVQSRVTDVPSFHPQRNEMLVTIREEQSYRVASVDLSTGHATMFGPTGQHLWYPQFSPDGNHVIAISDKGGEYDVLAWTYPDGAIQTVSSGDAVAPIWSKDGRWIYFRRDDGIFRVAVRTDGQLSVSGAEELVFEHPRLDQSRFDTATDGSLVSNLRDARTTDFERVRIFQNWGDHLRSLAEASN